MWLLLAGLALLTGDVLSQGFVRFQSTAPLRPIAPVSGFHHRPIIAPVRQTPIRGGTFSSSVIRDQTFGGPPGIPISHAISSGNPCHPTPCGPNTYCDEDQRQGLARCKCLDGYVPDGNTIIGCKPQCTSDGHCPSDYECSGQQCVKICVANSCGFNADCTAVNHQKRCSCPERHGGDPTSSCRLIIPEVRIPADLPIDPCYPNSPCGNNANCRARGERAVCSCPVGYEGDPLTNCIKGECIGHSDCPSHLACKNLRCFDPCPGSCGSGAECNTRNNQPVCSCPRQYVGDPFRSCRRLTEFDICNPTPCGASTKCSVRIEPRTGDMRGVCSCIDRYIGDPLTGCRPECTSDFECPASQGCRNNICRNPCVDGCGEGAYCDVANHRAVCSCPQYYLGDARSRCYPECTDHDDCPNHQACSRFRCIDPCLGTCEPGVACRSTCGTGAECKVENHTPICSCPRDSTGDPFEFCRKFTIEDLCRDNPCGTNADCTPGKDRSNNDRPVCTCPRGYIGNPLVSCRKGDCERHEECPDHQACYAFLCQSPCRTEIGSVCGTNSDCTVKNHTPVCQCPRGYTGNPLQGCAIAPNARIAGHLRTQKK